MLMSLDQFVFGVDTLQHQQLQRQMSWRHARNSRIGARAAGQFLSPGDDSITISGVLIPEIAGSLYAIDDLAAMGALGEAYVLVDGDGKVYGAFSIESIDQTGSYIRANGTPRKVEFSIRLNREDDSRATSRSESESRS
jgi:phage protein U